MANQIKLNYSTQMFFLYHTILLQQPQRHPIQLCIIIMLVFHNQFTNHQPFLYILFKNQKTFWINKPSILPQRHSLLNLYQQSNHRHLFHLLRFRVHFSLLITYFIYHLKQAIFHLYLIYQLWRLITKYLPQLVSILDQIYLIQYFRS